MANIITPNGQIQQVQLAPMNQLQGVQGMLIDEILHIIMNKN